MNIVPLIAALVTAAGPAIAFDLASPDIVPGEPIPEAFAFDDFGCTGQNLSPALAWTDAPEGTESFAVMVHDADAVTGGAGFWHWVVLDIPASEAGLPQGTADGTALPDGAREIATDFGVPGWGGPCPPEADGPHRYDVTVYALPVAALKVPDGATAPSRASSLTRWRSARRRSPPPTTVEPVFVQGQTRRNPYGHPRRTLAGT